MMFWLNSRDHQVQLPRPPSPLTRTWPVTAPWAPPSGNYWEFPNGNFQSDSKEIQSGHKWLTAVDLILLLIAHHKNPTGIIILISESFLDLEIKHLSEWQEMLASPYERLLPDNTLKSSWQASLLKQPRDEDFKILHFWQPAPAPTQRCDAWFEFSRSALNVISE